MLRLSSPKLPQQPHGNNHGIGAGLQLLHRSDGLCILSDRDQHGRQLESSGTQALLKGHSSLKGAAGIERLLLAR